MARLIGLGAKVVDVIIKWGGSTYYIDKMFIMLFEQRMYLLICFCCWNSYKNNYILFIKCIKLTYFSNTMKNLINNAVNMSELAKTFIFIWPGGMWMHIQKLHY